MLLQHVRSKAVRVNVGVTLGVGQQIDLAMSLFERLLHFMVNQPISPVADRCRIGLVQRMPELDGCLAVEPVNGPRVRPDQ